MRIGSRPRRSSASKVHKSDACNVVPPSRKRTLRNIVLQVADSRSHAINGSDISKGGAVKSSGIDAALITLQEAIVERVRYCPAAVMCSCRIVRAADDVAVPVLFDHLIAVIRTFEGR